MTKIQCGEAAVQEILEQDEWFAGLPAALKQQVITQGAVRRYRNNALVFAAGDEPTGLFCLLSGQVNLVNYSPAGKQMAHGLFRPGSWFGYLSVFDGQPRFQDAVAVGEAGMLFLSMSAFRRIISANPEWFQHFALLLCRSVRTTLGMLVDYRTTSFSSRLAAVLLDMSPPAENASDARRRAPRVTQEALASIVGASRQTVNRQLRDWQARNVVRLGYGMVTVVDRRALACVSRAAAGHGRASG